jgi:hypothetical protein
MSEIDEKEIERRFETISKFELNPEVAARDIERTRRTLTGLISKQRTIPRRICRIIMKNRITKLTAAAILIVGVLLGLYFVGNPFAVTVTFAQVIQPLLNARTASLDIFLGSQENPHVIHDEVMGSRIRRTVSNVKHSDIIIDLEQQRMLSLDHTAKTAVYIELGGLDNIKNYVELLRNMIINLKSKPDFQVKELRLQKMNGKEYIVFVAESEGQTITIWADEKTALPVRIEQWTPNLQIECDNLQFDIPLDESRFSMEVPDGYVEQRLGQIDFSQPNEGRFIEALRIWAEIIEGGHFPDSIDIENAVEIGLQLDRGLRRSGLTKQEQSDVAIQFAQGLVFIRSFNGEGRWHYAGIGVELGDSKTPIFWYRPKDSDVWHVIYGDLHVEDVEEKYLPDPELTDTQARILESSVQWKDQEFVGREKDLWHVSSSGNIVACSHVTLTKVPQSADSMYIRLPYSEAVLESVKLNDEEVPFAHLIRDRYEVTLPQDKLDQGETNLTFDWVVNMDAIEKADLGYWIKLQGLIPVMHFKLTIALEEDCGFQFSDKYVSDPSVRTLDSFTSSEMSSARMELGACRLPVKKSD